MEREALLVDGLKTNSSDTKGLVRHYSWVTIISVIGTEIIDMCSTTVGFRTRLRLKLYGDRSRKTQQQDVPN